MSRRKSRAVGLMVLAAVCLLGFIYFSMDRTMPLPAQTPRASKSPLPHPPYVFEQPPSVAPTARIGLILDDFGASRFNVERCLALPDGVAIAVIPHLPKSSAVARAAYDRGFEVFLHQPMEPRDFPKENPGRYGIYLWQTSEEMSHILLENMKSLGVPPAGVNNHMGSRATETEETMRSFFGIFPRHLIFLDSRTSSQSVAYRLAGAAGIRALKNNVFLDAVRDTSAIEKAFDQLLRQARSGGSAIGLGHADCSETILLLERRLPRLSEEGVRLVRLSAIAADKRL